MSKTRHGHVGLFVADLELSVAFYRDNLGGVPQEALVLAEDFIIQHVLFDGFDLELVKQPGPVSSCDGPLNHLCFDTDDASAEYESLQAAGYEIDEELVDNEFVAYFFFRGPDHERIEMMQRKMD
jgi:catechol 2,3-dioxygenase-like lactoylglutathione lyase family enzyme